MNRQSAKYTLFNAVTPVTVTSSTDATPIVVTATAHGLVTGDFVGIYGHTTNVAANGIFYVVKTTANAFELHDRATQVSVAGSGAGAGASGVLVKNPKIILAEDFKQAVLTVVTSGTTTATLKLAGSLGLPPEIEVAPNGTGDVPNMGGTVAKGNNYTFLDLVDLDTNAVINGSTGIVVAGTDIAKSFEVNVNAIKYLDLIVVSWTAGVVNVVLDLFDNE